MENRKIIELQHCGIGTWREFTSSYSVTNVTSLPITFPKTLN